MSHDNTLWLQSASATSDAAIWSVYQESAARHARNLVRPGTSIEFHGVSTTYPGVDSLDSAVHLVAREMTRNAIIAEQKGYAAFVNVTTTDAGRDEIRELIDIPSIFITEATVHLAAQMGGRFGFLTHNSGIRRQMERITGHYGLGHCVVDGASLELTYHDFVKLYADPAAGCEAFRAEARKVIARGARVLIPAGGPLNMFFVDHGLREVDGVPILDILAVSIKAAEQAIALRQAGVPLKAADFVPADRKAQLRQIFAGPRMSKGPDMETIGQMLLVQSATLGERVAIHDEVSQLSYRELTDASLRVAAYLVDAGVAPGDRIALLMPPSTEWATVHYGIIAAGAIAVPLNLAWQAEELSFALRQAQVSRVVCSAESRGRPLAARLIDAMSTSVRMGDDPGEAPGTPSIQLGVIFGSKNALPQGWRRGSDMLAHTASAATEKEVLHRIESATPRSACCLVYTSGSTGRPKPAVLHHFGVLQAAWEYGAGMDMNSSDRVLVPWPTFHVSGITAGMLVANLREATCWLMESYDPAEALRIIERERITAFFGFDTTFTTMITRADFSPSRVASMQRMLLATGPAMYDRVFNAFPNLRVGMKCYAMTETCGPTALMYPRVASLEQRKYGNGVMVPLAQMRVCDPQTGLQCATGIRGEIRLRGRLLFDGYYGMPQQTRDAFDSEGWFRTGDLGWFDDDGLLFYDGRLKRMIKTGGENVSEREVESFLEERIPGVNIAQVVGIPDALWGEAVVAFLEPLQGTSLEEAGVRALCKGRIADYKIPKRVWVLSDSEWPRNEVGKISKDALVVRARAASEQ